MTLATDVGAPTEGVAPKAAVPLHCITAVTAKIPSLYPVDHVAEKTGVTAERLLDLAEAGYLPHWRIDGGPPMFSASEVKEWVVDNLVVRHEGAALPTKFFLIADRPPADGRMLPPVLRDVAGIRDISDVVSLRSGIYFLCHRSRVVYVGQATVAARRINEHTTTKDFDQVFFLPWPRWDLNQIEGAFIRLLEPPLNHAETGRLVGRGNPEKDKETLELLKSGPAGELLVAGEERSA